MRDDDVSLDGESHRHPDGCISTSVGHPQSVRLELPVQEEATFIDAGIVSERQYKGEYQIQHIKYSESSEIVVSGGAHLAMRHDYDCDSIAHRADHHDERHEHSLNPESAALQEVFVNSEIILLTQTFITCGEEVERGEEQERERDEKA